MSWFPPRWRTQRSAISNTNRMFSWVVQFSNAPCTSLRKEVCLLECLLLFKQLCVKALIIVFLSSSLFVRKQGVLLCAFVCVCVCFVRKKQKKNKRKKHKRKTKKGTRSRKQPRRWITFTVCRFQACLFCVVWRPSSLFCLERGDSCVCVLSFVCFLLPFLLSLLSLLFFLFFL